MQLEIMAWGRIKRNKLNSEQLAKIGRNISKAHLLKPPEVRSALARNGGIAMQKKHPNLISERVKHFWSNLRNDPIKFRTFIDRRAVAIKLARRNA